MRFHFPNNHGGFKPFVVMSILTVMEKFFKRHGQKIITVVIGAGLLSTLDWNWTNVKSFISGGVIVFYLWTIFAEEAE